MAIQLNVDVTCNPTGVTTSTQVMAPPGVAVTSSTYVASSYLPPAAVDQTPLNTGSLSSSAATSLTEALLKIIAAIDPQLAPAIHRLEQGLGLTAPSTGGSSLGGGSSLSGSSSLGGGSSLSGSSSLGRTSSQSYTPSTQASASSGSYISPSTSGGSSSLAQNRQAVLAAAKSQGLSQDKINTIMTIGNIETNDMNASQRDSSKDGTPSENYSAFNLNKGMLLAMGYDPSKGPDLNDPKNVGLAVHLMSQAMDKWGTNGFLAWHRGGEQGFKDGHSYGVQDYIRAVNAGSAMFAANPSLLTSSQRLSTGDLPHV